MNILSDFLKKLFWLINFDIHNLDGQIRVIQRKNIFQQIHLKNKYARFLRQVS